MTDAELKEAILQFVSKRLDEKLEALDARLEEFIAEIEVEAKIKAIEKFKSLQELEEKA